jgi:hypothetical protein
MANPAWKVASDVADGYVSLNPVVLKKYERHEVEALVKELEKLTRDTRSQAIPQDDAEASATRSRRLLRLSQANVVLQAWRSRMPKPK